MSDLQSLQRVLEEISAQQKQQLELQREHLEILRKQTDRSERIQDRAEKLQDRSAQIMSGARRSLFILLPIIIVLVIYVSWLLFKRPYY